MSAIYDTKAFCHSHPQEPAVAICFHEKAFLCPDCLVEDKHLNNKVVTLKKLNNFLQEKKEILIQHHEKAQSNPVNNIQTKEITKAILTKIEPIIHEIVAAELKEKKNEPQDIKELLKKVDNLIVNNQATGSIEVLEELEKETKRLESANLQNINNIVKKVSDLLQGTSMEDSDRQEQIKNISIDIGTDFNKFTLLPGKDSYSGLEIVFGRKSDNMSSFCSELNKFKRLEELQLDFCFCTTINDDKIQELSQTLKNMTSLTKLQIKFWDAMSVSDIGLKELSSALKSLTSLTELRLQFTCSSVIGNAGLKELSLALTSLSSLTSLQLNFTSCNSVSNVGLKELNSSLKRLTCLTKLSLDFSSCGVIRDVEVKDLIFTIKSLDTLTHLQLDFSGIDSISEEGKTELDLLLKSYKQL